MRKASRLIVVLLAVLCAPLFAQEPNRSWIKSLKDPSKRGALTDSLQRVRGDSGKWSEQARLQHAPPMQKKPAKLALDDWFEQLLESDFQLTGGDDNWLLLRTRQLNDNDRLWVERIERRGNQFTVVAAQAVWRGKYFKNFTYHTIAGVNLGKLEPGKYQAKWIIKPLEFTMFDQPGRRPRGWPKDERPTGKKPTELSVSFSIVAAP